MTTLDAEREFLIVMERVINANLRDADLAAMTPEYQSGYVRGFKEAVLSFVLAKARTRHDLK